MEEKVEKLMSLLSVPRFDKRPCYEHKPIILVKQGALRRS